MGANIATSPPLTYYHAPHLALFRHRCDGHFVGHLRLPTHTHTVFLSRVAQHWHAPLLHHTLSHTTHYAAGGCPTHIDGEFAPWMWWLLLPTFGSGGSYGRLVNCMGPAPVGSGCCVVGYMPLHRTHYAPCHHLSHHPTTLSTPRTALPFMAHAFVILGRCRWLRMGLLMTHPGSTKCQTPLCQNR